MTHDQTVRVAVVARSVYPLHGIGGLERSVYDLARHLSRAGVEVTLITRSATRDDRSVDLERVRTIFVPYRTFPLAGRRGTTIVDRSTAYPLFGLRAGAAALDLVRRGEVDVVHGFGASVLGYARARQRASAPLVLNPQGMEEFSGGAIKRTLYWPLRQAVRTCARRADRVIATDRSLVEPVRRFLGVPPPRIATIPNAVDLDALDRLAPAGSDRRVREGAGIPPEAAVLLSAGRIEQNKGFHVLVDALAALDAHGAGQNWRWVLAGDGPFRRALERRIDTAGIRNRVVLPGRIDDAVLHAWYEAATVFVHPTLYEGSSLVTLEAMAHRRPVVATTAGGLRDKVRTGVNGVLVEPGRPDALAAALSGMLARSGDLDRMGQEGRRIVEAEFSWPIAAARHAALYRELLSRSRVNG